MADAVGDNDEPDDPFAHPGKAAESPAHRARAFIAQFLALSDGHENPFKAFGQIVSQIAQGRTFEEIFPAPEREEAGDEAPAAIQPAPVGDPVDDQATEPTLLEIFAEQEQQDKETSAS